MLHWLLCTNNVICVQNCATYKRTKLNAITRYTEYFVQQAYSLILLILQRRDDMVTTRHAAASLPGSAARRSTRKASATKDSAAEPTTVTETTAKAPSQPAAQHASQHQTLQHLASMLWQALDDEDDAASSDEEPDAAPPQPADDASLAWAPTLALDDAPLLSDTPMRKEPGLAAQPRALPRTTCPPQSTSSRWSELPAQEIDDQTKRDLRLLRLRAAYDPTRHYKSWGKGKFPKHFSVGTVIEGPGEFFTGALVWLHARGTTRRTERLTRKERKGSLADQLLADQELTAARKKRFAKMQEDASRWSLRKNKRQRQAEPPRKHRARAKY